MFVTSAGEFDRFSSHVSTLTVAILRDACQHTELHNLWILTSGSVGNHHTNLKFHIFKEKCIIKMCCSWCSFQWSVTGRIRTRKVQTKISSCFRELLHKRIAYGTKEETLLYLISILYLALGAHTSNAKQNRRGGVLLTSRAHR